MLQVDSLNEQWRNAQASCRNLQCLCYSQVLEGIVQHFHRGAADQRRREVRAIYEVPVSQASMGQPIHSPLLGCVCWNLETVGRHISGYLCHHQLILCPRKPLPMGLCSFFQSLGFRILLHTVVGDKAYLPTSIMQDPVTKFSQRSDRMADLKSLVILK